MQHPLTAKEAEECGKNSRARFFISLDTRIVSPELILAVRRLPQPQNNIVKYCVLQIRLKKIKFVTVLWVGLMIHHECCNDRLFPNHETGVGREASPPPSKVTYLNRLFDV
jgi:hypothetical protein